ncbi:MAG: NAD(P)-dependent oxidoreductase [Blastocatellia bacterium]|nr:NAD(P)-dependent oxidoreductase [Blastocatellia bacterium]
MKILVTGGSGFLGTHLVKFFEADNFSRRSNLDILNMQDVSTVENYDVVIHLAAFLDKSPENAEECFLTNVEGTVNLLRAVKEDSVFIFASTKDVYGLWADNFEEVPERCLTDYCGQSPLEWSKLIAEKYVEFYGRQNNFRTCIFRLSTIYAPLSAGNEPNFVTHYLDAINVGETIILPEKGRPKRDFLHVEDFALACQAFINSDITRGLYNLGGGYKNALTLRQLVEKIERIVGANAVIDESVITPTPIPYNYVSDISRAENELKWKPTISLDEGLKTLLI